MFSPRLGWAVQLDKDVKPASREYFARILMGASRIVPAFRVHQKLLSSTRIQSHLGSSANSSEA
jgi:hypothetical protein